MADDTPDECVCVFPDDGYSEGVYPDDGFPDQCHDLGPSKLVCTRPPGHDGPHVACNTFPEHRLDDWNDGEEAVEA